MSAVMAGREWPERIKWIGLLGIIKLGFVFVATLIFARFSPLIDSQLYLEGHFVTDKHLRTRFIQELACLVNGIGGDVFAHWAFGMISCAGLVYYILKGGKRWSLVILLFLPSSMIWTSIVGKEAIFYGAFSLALFIWSRYVTSKPTGSDLALLLASLAVCGLLRPHYGVAIGWLFGSMFLLKILGNRAWPILAVIWLAAAAVSYEFIWTELLERGWGGVDPDARASRFMEFGMTPKSLSGYYKFRNWALLGTIIGIVGPLPQEVLARPEFLPFLVEGVFILLFPVGVGVYVSTCRPGVKKEFFRIYWPCIVPAIIALMLIHAPLGLLNPGTATRWRVDFETIFYLAPLLLLFRIEDADRREDTPLSS